MKLNLHLLESHVIEQEAEKKVKPEEPTLPPAVYLCEHKGLAEIYLLTAEARVEFLRGKYQVREVSRLFYNVLKNDS